VTIQNLMNLKGRRAMVTGATGGLGTVIAETLAELGSDLILIDRDKAEIEALQSRLSDTFGVSVIGSECDLEQQDQREVLINEIVRDGQELNVLVNNAAFVGTSNLLGWNVPFIEQSVETWRRALEVNLVAAFELCRGMSQLMKHSRGANIINIASIYGQFAPDWRMYENTNMSNPAAYGASKAGLIQLTKWLSTTLAPDVRVNAISPGGVFTGQPDDFVQSYNSRTPIRRMASYDDLRGGIAYLATDMSEYVTGQVLNIDGGWGVW
jgi:NAD(P)-dependent dehydrogenase (short-subunit alcohol dehydrogenase family)